MCQNEACYNISYSCIRFEPKWIYIDFFDDTYSSGKVYWCLQSEDVLFCHDYHCKLTLRTFQITTFILSIFTRQNEPIIFITINLTQFTNKLSNHSKTVLVPFNTWCLISGKWSSWFDPSPCSHGFAFRVGRFGITGSTWRSSRSPWRFRPSRVFRLFSKC